MTHITKINITPYDLHQKTSTLLLSSFSFIYFPLFLFLPRHQQTRSSFFAIQLKVANKLNRRLCQKDKGGPNLVTLLRSTFLLKDCFLHAKTDLSHCPGNTLFNNEKGDFQYHATDITTNRCDFLW